MHFTQLTQLTRLQRGFRPSICRAVAVSSLRRNACSSTEPPAPPVQVIEADLRTKLTLLTLPVRNFLRNLRVQPLNLVFQRPPWNASEFAQGTVEAFRRVSELRESGDYASLQHLVPEMLVEQLRQDATVAQEAWGARSLLHVQPLGVFTTKLWPDENRHLSLWVTQVLRVKEEYSCNSGSGERWHVERLHRCTFKRVLLNDHAEEVSDWKLVALDKGCWLQS
eukprot:TRINITY_DN58892_c0_g1_i1.p1 TRINITY_DN58892_c0_g1~~TRINITY_DN58892_c0_g1_i1.p1  ORF type:complete len:223 (-),score=25.18 TRINITY_DN58892_c0_g1_i1:94-762(-)